MPEFHDPRPSKLAPPTVFKTRVLELIDRLSGNRELVSRAVADLRNGKPLLAVGVESGAVEGDPERIGHLDAHWLGGEHERGVLSAALIRAGELALEHQLPIDAYWVFAGDRFEAAVSRNRQQITLLVVRPLPAVATEGEAPPNAGIEIFR